MTDNLYIRPDNSNSQKDRPVDFATAIPKEPTIICDVLHLWH
jgi:hypothetical protein